MESKFKVGDRVFIPSINKYATVVENSHLNLLWHEIALLLKYDDGIEAYCLESNCKLDDSYDPTTAFLTELQALMRKYDACINISWNNYFDKDNAPCIDMDIDFDNSNIRNGICYHDILSKTLTPDNIFDYDKE